MSPEEAAQQIRDKAGPYAQAKGQRVYIEQFLKTKISILKKQALERGISASNAQDREAYADPDYVELLKGLAVAIETEDRLKWEIEAARLDIEIWRTREATARTQDRSHR